MPARRSRSAALLLLVISCWSCDAILASEVVILSIRVCEEVPNQDKPRILAQPTVAARVDNPVTLDIGGVAKSKFDRSEHEIGTKLVARLTREQNSTYVLHLKSTLAHQQHLPDDPHTEAFVSHQVTLRTVLAAGERKKIPISANRWYELLIGQSTDTLEGPRR